MEGQSNAQRLKLTAVPEPVAGLVSHVGTMVQRPELGLMTCTMPLSLYRADDSRILMGIYSTCRCTQIHHRNDQWLTQPTRQGGPLVSAVPDARQYNLQILIR